MENKKEKLVLDGNAFYELDLECLKHRRENMQREKERRAERNRQRQRKCSSAFCLQTVVC